MLRMTVGGGLRYPGATVEVPEVFTLYRDGRVIYATRGEGPPDSSARFDLFQAQLDERQQEALLEFALDEGGLAVARERYEYGGIADDATTWFEVVADGSTKTVSVYALGYDDEGVPDKDMRARFEVLARELRRVGARVQSGEVESVGSYLPEGWLITLDEPFGPMIDGPARPWPWDDLEPTDFAPGDSGLMQAVITAAQAAQVADPVNSVPDDYVIETEDGERFLLRLRPLLPDQVP